MRFFISIYILKNWYSYNSVSSKILSQRYYLIVWTQLDFCCFITRLWDCWANSGQSILLYWSITVSFRIVWCSETVKIPHQCNQIKYLHTTDNEIIKQPRKFEFWWIVVVFMLIVYIGTNSNCSLFIVFVLSFLIWIRKLDFGTFKYFCFVV